MKGVIYYTDNSRLDAPIIPMAQRFITESGLPITSVSLKPINFGKNIVLEGKHRGVYTMNLQIITALENSMADYVFFCEHDCLYHKSHFDFIPPRDDTYYYNTNVWRWRYHSDLVVTHDKMMSLSNLCCSRELALKHFKLTQGIFDKVGLDQNSNKQPRWVRSIGYEPGTKDSKYGFPSEPVETWSAQFPNIDIRHRFCYTNRLIEPKNFRHMPKNWQESTIDKIPGWNLPDLFNGYLTVP